MEILTNFIIVTCTIINENINNYCFCLKQIIHDKSKVHNMFKFDYQRFFSLYLAFL